MEPHLGRCIWHEYVQVRVRLILHEIPMTLNESMRFVPAITVPWFHLDFPAAHCFFSTLSVMDIPCVDFYWQVFPGQVLFLFNGHNLSLHVGSVFVTKAIHSSHFEETVTS